MPYTKIPDSLLDSIIGRHIEAFTAYAYQDLRKNYPRLTENQLLDLMEDRISSYFSGVLTTLQIQKTESPKPDLEQMIESVDRIAHQMGFKFAVVIPSASPN